MWEGLSAQVTFDLRCAEWKATTIQRIQGRAFHAIGIISAEALSQRRVENSFKEEKRQQVWLNYCTWRGKWNRWCWISRWVSDSQGLAGHSKEFVFYSTSNEKSLKDMSRGVFMKNYCGFYVIMDCKGARGGKRNQFTDSTRVKGGKHGILS